MAESSRKLVREGGAQEQHEGEARILYTNNHHPSSPHGFGSVCCCRGAIFSINLFLFFSFSEASSRTFSIPTTITPVPSPTNSPTDSPLKTHNHTHFDSKFVAPLIIFSAILTFLFATMVLLKCFGLKLKRNKNRVGSSSAVTEIETKENYDQIISGMISTSCVRKFSWVEIERCTNNFSKVIGSGGYSNVYLAHCPEYSGHGFWAVKIHNGSERLNLVFKQELDILLRLQHDNIVKLLGYCDERDEGALFFEYVPNGTLQEKLHGSGQCALPWKNRMIIAFQIAKAIEYLHEKCDLQIVHMDIKASNILLDGDLNSKLCDFGSAKMGFSSTVQPTSPGQKKQFLMMGSPGYTDPQYLRTGIASKKNDVYSFGVMLLELVTGTEAFCPEKGQLLTASLGPRLNDGGEIEAAELAEMVDGRLGRCGGFDVEEARAVISLAATCLRQSPRLRPSVTQILKTITDRIPSVAFVQESPKSAKCRNHRLD